MQCTTSTATGSIPANFTPREGETTLPPHVQARVRRILDGAARRLLAEESQSRDSAGLRHEGDVDAVGAPPRAHVGALHHSPDQRTLLLKRQ